MKFLRDASAIPFDGSLRLLTTSLARTKPKILYSV